MMAAGCNPLNLGGCISQGIQSGIEKLAETFKEGAEWAMKTLTTAWLKAPSPDLTSAHSPVVWLQSHLWYFVLVSVFVSVLVAAYRMATTGSFDHLGELAQGLGRVLLVAGLVASATATAVQVGDLFAAWILDKSQVDFSNVVVLAAISNPGIVILLAIIVILAQIIQLGLMLVRNGMIVLLVGSLTLTSSAANTSLGRQTWQKSLAWLIAFVLYKPVAALIYAACFKMSSKDQDISTQLSGIFMMLLAIFALPALMRFLVPATAAMSGGNAGGMAAGLVGAAVATGAMVATGGASAAGAAGASGSGFSGGATMTGAVGGGGGSGGSTTGAPSGASPTGGGGGQGSSGDSPGQGPAGAAAEAAGAQGQAAPAMSESQSTSGPSDGGSGSSGSAPSRGQGGQSAAASSGSGSSGASRWQTGMNAASTGANMGSSSKRAADDAVGDQS